MTRLLLDESAIEAAKKGSERHLARVCRGHDERRGGADHRERAVVGGGADRVRAAGTACDARQSG